MDLLPGPFFATLKHDGVYDVGDGMAKAMNSEKISNVKEVADFIVFDVFVCNNDRNYGNSMLVPFNGSRKFKYVLLDHGYCFDGPCLHLAKGQDLPYRTSFVPWKTDGIVGESSFKNATDRMSLTDAEMDSLLASMPREWRLEDAEYANLKYAMTNRSKESIMEAIYESGAQFGGLI